MLQQFAGGASTPGNKGEAKPGVVQRDEKTGEDYIRLPMPTPQVVEQALNVVQMFLSQMKK